MSEPEELSALVAALRAAQSHADAVAAAVHAFAEQLYAGVDQAAEALIAAGAPGVGRPHRFGEGRYERLRFGWRESAIVIVPQAGVRLPPDATPEDADRPGLGRVLIFQTAPEEEHHGAPIRDYLIAADGSWRFVGLGGAGEGPQLEADSARRHAIELLGAIQSRLRSKWVEAGQITVMSEEGDDRAIGFVA